MAKLFSKDTLVIAFSTDQNTGLKCLDECDNVNDILIKRNKSNIVIVINPNFYKKNKLFLTKLINENANGNISNVLLTNASFFQQIDNAISVTAPTLSVHFTKNANVRATTFNSFTHIKYKKFTFEDDINSRIAETLIKANVPFYTTKPYSLLDASKFTSDTEMLTLSDYYSITNLSINSDLSAKDLKSLNKLFEFNRYMYEINISASIESSLNIVKSYLENISKYSHAHFKITLPSIILSKSDNERLYEINKTLKANNCKLSLISPTKEVITYTKYTSTLAPLRKFANKLNSLELSTLEKLILIEDYCKSKPYKDSKTKSLAREFFNSRNSDFIVCHTYSHTFKALCDYAGIACTTATGRITSRSGQVISEHTKIICNIIDEKYNLHAPYIFEPTFDSVSVDSKLDGEKPCDSYLYFANTFNQYNEAQDMTTEEFGLLKLATSKNDFNSKNERIEAIRQLNDLYNTKYSIDSNSKAVSIALHSAVEKLNTAYEIDLDTFKLALNTARNSLGNFNEEDMDRILEINSIRALESMSLYSTNRFNDPDKHFAFEDEVMIDFDEI